jgi:hypothetical protein
MYGGLNPVNKILVELNDTSWLFATQNKDRISDFWREKATHNTHFYNGQVHIMTSWEIRGAETDEQAFVGNMCRTSFAAFLYWKSFGSPSQQEVDFSGGAALICRDGALLLVVSGDHTIAPGMLEFPSGFVDVSDFEDNRLNFDRHVEREVTEELIIHRKEICRRSRYLVSAADGIVQVLSVFAVDMEGDNFVEQWRRRAGPLRSEISEVVPIYRSSDLAGFSVQEHVRTAVPYLLSGFGAA